MNYYRHKGRFLFFPLIGTAFVIGGGFAVMYLWNAILPEVITSVGKVTFIQAIGLLVLCRILFGGFKGRCGGHWGGHCGSGYGWRSKMQGMTEEEKEKFKSEWRDRCGKW